MKKRIIILMALLFMCMGVGMVHSEAKQSKVIDRDGFYIVDGVLVRYTGELAPGKEIVLPDEVKVIGNRAFSVYNYIKDDGSKPEGSKPDVPEEWKTYYMKLVIPKGVKLGRDTYERDYGFAFEDSISLDLYYEEGIKTLDRESRMGGICRCKVHLPKSLKEVKDFAFSGIAYERHNTRIYLNKGIEKIGSYAFSEVTVDNVLPKALKEIGKEAFMFARFVDRKTDFADDDSLLKVPVLPEGLEIIGEGAFFSDVNDKSEKKEVVRIPASVRRMEGESRIFSYPGSTVQYLFKVDKKNKCYSSDKNGWLYSKDKRTLYYAEFDYEHNVIPESVRNIELMSLSTNLDMDDMEKELLNIYFPKKLEKVTRYPGNVYHCVFVFRGNKAPKLIKFKGKYPSDYRREKWLNGDKDKYFLVKKGLKSKFIKNLKLQNYPKSRIKER